MAEECSSSSAKKSVQLTVTDADFTKMVLSWSLDDILNQNLFIDKVVDIPLSFNSIDQYFGAFIYPLLEDIRAKIFSTLEDISNAPFAELASLNQLKSSDGFSYDITVNEWRVSDCWGEKEPYKTMVGDLVLFSHGKPEIVSDLHREARTWTLAWVMNVNEIINDDSNLFRFKVMASNVIDGEEARHSLYVVFLVNVLSEKRIWDSLHKPCNSMIIEKVLGTGCKVDEDCRVCVPMNSLQLAAICDDNILSELNQSQRNAVEYSLLRTNCLHIPSVELIWGPPGTGKTKTIVLMLLKLLSMKLRTLVCTLTNIAIKEIASRLLKVLKDSCKGDLLLLENDDKLDVDGGLEEIYLDFRVNRLTECFGPLGWNHCLKTMSCFLTNCVQQYDVYLDNVTVANGKSASFLEFARTGFDAAVSSLRNCIFTLSTHLPQHIIKDFKMMKVMHLIDQLRGQLFDDNVSPIELKKILSHDSDVDSLSPFLLQTKIKAVLALQSLHASLHHLELPNAMNEISVKEFCLRGASLIFSTSSTSYKLHSAKMEPFKVLVIDEALQLKECESTIPLQLPGIMHAILVGDEHQLSAIVSSNVSEIAGFGRSLFERLCLMGHPKHLLSTQYRMHPSICLFPNSKFYSNIIMDAQNVTKYYERNYLTGPMFGPYSFINIPGYEEENKVGRSLRNLVEVAVILRVLRNLHEAWSVSKKRLSIGIISPYAAQVTEIKNKLPSIYEDLDGFKVKVMSIDEFQGGEEDIIMISTVRSNAHGNVGFLSSHQRTNIALTRARHCLWILGSGRTLEISGTIWGSLVHDAKKRQCYFNADEVKDLQKAILTIKKKLHKWNDLLNGKSSYFKDAPWKVLFSNDFKKSFYKLCPSRKKDPVMKLLVSLLSGWRPKYGNVDLSCDNSSYILKQFKVEGLYIVCTIDINKEEQMYIQVLKIWDLLPSYEIPKLVKRIEGLFSMYTDDYISHCNEKVLHGNLEFPMSWPLTFNIIQYKTRGHKECENLNCDNVTDNSNYVENSKVSESFMLMKFYSLSSGVTGQLLSNEEGKELELPFELTYQERQLVLFPQSTFIIGRSGTGKTTVLTMKLFETEQRYKIASRGFNATSSDVGDTSQPDNEIILRQLFVTVSPKLCYAIKKHLSGLKRFVRGGRFLVDNNSEDYDDDAYDDIPDSFLDIPPQSYPLVITFHKFLMILDGSAGHSFFKRFAGIIEKLYGKTLNSKSVALQTFIRTKEVTYDRFYSLYWPRFNSNLTKRFDPLRVFSEITSCIKGGLQAGQTCNGKLSLEEYLSLADARTSSLTKEKRQEIYEIFLLYEKLKIKNGEFDLIDLVIDLHHRLQGDKFQGTKIDFVYIDEVQDLTMQQIALFKYVCKNVEEGFVFSGDTAQTIARGVDFRFEDIRCLFYNQFILESRGGDASNMKISDIFSLSQNFRTHDGVLRLAQSVINIIYHFFPQSIDFLNPERSLIYGEAPVLFEYGNDENAIVKIFGRRESKSSNIVGFGADQVILVRDDVAREEISYYVGKHAVVLTIMESKGLEFEDVLLYNFFGSSPLKNQWRVVYEFMKLQNLHDDNCKSFPSFDTSRHGILCSELKQLYVAITRTRQRLWICENKEELSEPMFDYWKKLSLVQIKQLEHSLAQEMQVTSCREDWKQRGIKLFYENKYEMATMCFEKAGELTWERRAKATGLKAGANCLHGWNNELAFSKLSEACKIFESIGRPESAAECLFEMGEYEKAGRIYVDKCRKPELRKAGECFFLAGCLEIAADAYSQGGFFSECLSVCTNGKLYDRGLKYIEYWRKHVAYFDGPTQNFLSSCAMNYYELDDRVSMMKFAREIQSIDAKRQLLKSLDCPDELLLVEQEESGNFLKAAKIAKLKGYILLEADLMMKAGLCSEAARLVLWFVFYNSLWVPQSKGWPLKSFTEKEELLEKAISYVRTETNFYKLSIEAKILSSKKMKLSDLTQYWHSSESSESLRGEILCIWKILDDHVNVNASKYKLEDELAVDPTSHSVRSLLFFWDLWTEKIDKITGCLESTQTKEVDENNGYALFCFEYFGVRKQFINLNINTYLLLNPKADWVKQIDRKSLIKERSLFYVELRHFASFAIGYWCSELVDVGLKVLETLEAVYAYSIRASPSLFCSTVPLLEALISIEAMIVSNEKANLSYLIQYMHAFVSNGNLRGEILSIPKILDIHLHSNASKYDLEDELVVVGRNGHSKNVDYCHSVSVTTLVHFWDLWTEKIDSSIRYIESRATLDVDEKNGYALFFFQYFCVRKNPINMNISTYLLLNPEANWVKEIDRRFLRKEGNLLYADFSNFAPVALDYWRSELLQVSLKVLGNLEDIYTFFIKASPSLFCKTVPLQKLMISIEDKILSNEKAKMSDLIRYFHAFVSNGKLQYEIVSIRRILNIHLNSDASEFELVAVDPVSHSENVSVKSLLYFWNLWAEKMNNSIGYIESLQKLDIDEKNGYALFFFQYFCVRKKPGNMKSSTYLLLNPDADWVKNIDKKILIKQGDLLYADFLNFVSVALGHWRLDLVHVSLKVLETLEAIYAYSISTSPSHFCKTMPLLKEVISIEDKLFIKAKLPELHSFVSYGKPQYEIMSIRRILDMHLHSNASKYDLEDELVVVDPISHAENVISRDSVSIISLVYFWNLWAEKMNNSIGYIESLDKNNGYALNVDENNGCSLNIDEKNGCAVNVDEKDGCAVNVDEKNECALNVDEKNGCAVNVDEKNGYALFFFQYFCVRKKPINMNSNTYLLLNPEADWVKKIDRRFLEKEGNLLYAAFHNFVSVALDYWHLELVHVRLKVLETLDAICKASPSPFCSIVALLCNLMISNSLDLKHIFITYNHELNWNQTLAGNFFSIRRTNDFQRLLQESMLAGVSSKGNLTYGQIGRIMVLYLSTGRPTDELYKNIAERLSCYQSWRLFFEDTDHSIESHISQKLSSANKLMIALRDTYNANWRMQDYISPTCFLYIMERLLLLSTCYKKFLYTTKSVFVEWIIYEKEGENHTNNPGEDSPVHRDPPVEIFDFIEYLIKEFLYGPETYEWIQNSGVNTSDFYSAMVLRCVIMSCLLCLNTSNDKYRHMLNNIMSRRHITSKLPANFYTALQTSNNCLNTDVISEALAMIGNPLVIVCWQERDPLTVYPGDAILLDLIDGKNRDSILSLLFPPKTTTQEGETNESVKSEAQGKTAVSLSLSDPEEISTLFQEISYALRSTEDATDKCSEMLTSHLQNIKIELEKLVMVISSSQKENYMGEDDRDLMQEVNHTIEDLKHQLNCALDIREMGEGIPLIFELLRNLNMQKPILEMFFRKKPKSNKAEATNDGIDKECESGGHQLH